MDPSLPCEALVLEKSIFYAISYDAGLHDFLTSFRRAAWKSGCAVSFLVDLLYVVHEFQNRIERIDPDNRSVWL